MIYQKDNIFWFKLNGLLRYLIVHLGCNGWVGYCLVNEYPKSGGSWMGQMLAEALGLPFPRNRLPMMTPSIIHGHYLKGWNVKKAVVVWRDGRDVLVSQYYHWLFKNERDNAPLVKMARRDLGFADYEDIQANLPAFIQYVYVTKRHPRFSWTDFVSQWVGKQQVVHVKYEDLRTDTPGELRRVVNELTGGQLPLATARLIAEKFSFANQANRNPGEENKNSFMRKGVVGDWTRHFSNEAKTLFAEYAGEALIQLGYEPDSSWAST